MALAHWILFCLMVWFTPSMLWLAWMLWPETGDE